MLTSGHLDWLEVTFSSDLDQVYWLPVQLLKYKLSVKPGRTKHYNLILTNQTGVLLFTRGEQREGVHVLYTGEPLENVRDAGVSDRQLIQHLMEYEGSITRLDVAVNLHGGLLKAQDLEREFLERRCKTRARGAQKRQKLLTDEDTLYIGSGISERFFRAYNKGAQLHQEETWLRLELELKKLAARTVGKAIMNETNTRAVFNKAIKDFVDFPALPEYQAALADQDVVIPRPARKMHSTYEWLLNVVAPALARYTNEHPDEDVYGAFTRLYDMALARLRRTNFDKP